MLGGVRSLGSGSRREIPGFLHHCGAPEMTRVVSSQSGWFRAGDPPAPSRVQGGPGGLSGPGGREAVRSGPRPRDSSSCGAGRVSGNAGFGMTQSPRQGPGASAALPICDSPTIGGSHWSHECLWKQPRPTVCSPVPRWWFCLFKNAQGRKLLQA